jgi:hypothetical protein
MGLITRTVKSTPLQWLPVLSNISPARLRREATLFRELKHCWSLLFDQLQVVLSIRLRLRSVIWTIDSGPLQDGYRIVDRWRVSVNGDIVDDPSDVPPGFDLERREWVILNRLRTSKGKFAYLMHGWDCSDSPVCESIFLISHWDLLKVVWRSCSKFLRRLLFVTDLEAWQKSSTTLFITIVIV